MAIYQRVIVYVGLDWMEEDNYIMWGRYRAWVGGCWSSQDHDVGVLSECSTVNDQSHEVILAENRSHRKFIFVEFNIYSHD